MPTYQYRCKDCGHDFEIQQSFSEDALETCPECSGSLKKVYGNVGISFKGSGFYKNDHGSRKSSTSTTTPTTSDSSSSSGSSSDSSSSSTSTTSEKATTSSSTSSSTSTSSSSD